MHNLKWPLSAKVGQTTYKIYLFVATLYKQEHDKPSDIAFSTNTAGKIRLSLDKLYAYVFYQVILIPPD